LQISNCRFQISNCKKTQDSLLDTSRLAFEICNF
jgi:hypothetical protein